MVDKPLIPIQLHRKKRITDSNASERECTILLCGILGVALFVEWLSWGTDFSLVVFEVGTWKFPEWGVDVLHPALMFPGLESAVHGAHVLAFDVFLLGDDLSDEFLVELDRG